MTLKEMISVYLQQLKVLNRSPATLRGIRYDLLELMRFLAEEKAHTIEDMTADVLADYQQELSFKLTVRGTPLTIGSQVRLLCAARGFTRYLKESDYLPTDPGAAIKLPRMPKPLPKVILSGKQIKALIRACDMHTVHGYRRRVILEILYDTGMRRAELTHVRLADMDLAAGYIHIRKGKGGKQRVVPVSGKVCELVQDYVCAVRCEFVKGDDPGYLLLNRWGKRMQPKTIWRQVKLAAAGARIKQAVTTHGLRHSCATHMLKNGAPVRHIQEMLGHESLESTQIYTRVTINDLKTVHAKYHPGNKL